MGDSYLWLSLQNFSPTFKAIKRGNFSVFVSSFPRRGGLDDFGWRPEMKERDWWDVGVATRSKCNSS